MGNLWLLRLIRAYRCDMALYNTIQLHVNIHSVLCLRLFKILKFNMNKSLIVIGLLCIASSLAFELPMVFDIGAFDPMIPRIHHQVQAAGPFVHPRNVTFNFDWETSHYTIYGVRIRGSEPRYDRVSLTVNQLGQRGYSFQVTVINTSFALFWAEPHGFEDIHPNEKAEA